MDCDLRFWRHRRADITLPGRIFRAFYIQGTANLDLDQIDQDRLKIVVAGSGKATASGKVDTLTVEIAGRGDMRLKDLIARNLNLKIAGRGEVETSPVEDADIEIAGSGDVSLYTEPAHLNSRILGSGNIRHLAGKRQ